ncbi:MAG: PTS sugar transporter subunit IIA [Lachnospiraceae bacterium]|nr:PTS sugar transporter subunit IIA [Lachnospiraceae bacterium]
MVKVIAVSHGSFSKGLVDSVQMLVGEQEELVAYGLYPEQTVATLKEKLKAELDATPKGVEILFLTDLFHGSPFNAVVDLMRDYDFYHVTGINIPLAVLVMMGRYSDKNAEEICRDLIAEAPDTVKYVNDMFDADDDDEEEE